MASPRVPAALLSTLGVVAVLTACTSAPSGAGTSGDVGYETVIAAVVLAESDASGRAFGVDVDAGTAQVHVAVGDREVEVDVDLAGPAVTDRREDGTLDAEDRSTVEAAATTLADGIRIAVAAHRDGGGVTDVDLDRRGGSPVWTVEFADGAEIAVATADGAVVRSES